MDLKSKKILSHKIKTANEIKKIIGDRPRKLEVIMCHGVFDIVHPGHIRHMVYAKTKAKILIASLTSDKYVKKGNLRPYVPEDLRAINLAALEIVDYVLIDHNETPIKSLKIIKPDYYAKGYEYYAKTITPKTEEEVKTLEKFGGEIIFTPGDIIYSSTSLLNISSPSIGSEKLLSIMENEKIRFKDLKNTIKDFKNKKVHVVGDTIVDSFTICSMIGGMTKTPTMSLKFEKKLDFVGGAAIVAKHIKAAGANVNFSTVLGNDKYKNFVLNSLKNSKIIPMAIIDRMRPTTNKNAIISEDYRLLKLDTLDSSSISDRMIKKINKQILSTKSDALVCSDFRHGIFNKKTIPQILNGVPKNIYKVADSQVASRWGNILDFKDFDLITPNEKETRFSLGDQDSILRPLANTLYNKARCKTLILKCGSRGIVVCRSEKKTKNFRPFFALDTFAETVIDPVGAGDALLAYSTLGMLSSKNEVIAAILGNVAAAIVCSQNGNIIVDSKKVLEKIEMIQKNTNYE